MMGPKVCCISAGRAFDNKGDSNVERMESLAGQPMHWYVPGEQCPEYRDAGAQFVVASGNLMDSRNLALDDAFKEGATCVQVSDDLLRLERKVPGRDELGEVSFLDAVTEIIDTMAMGGARYGGVAPTSNLFFASDEPKWRHFIVGDLIVVSETDLRFDTAMTLKEDYDYTCQHIQRYGLVARCDNLLATFKHKSNAGGAVAYRTYDREMQNIQHLMKKWPGVFKLNKKRPGEILLRWPGA